MVSCSSETVRREVVAFSPNVGSDANGMTLATQLRRQALTTECLPGSGVQTASCFC